MTQRREPHLPARRDVLHREIDVPHVHLQDLLEAKVDRCLFQLAVRQAESASLSGFFPAYRRP
jgi:hypothetical protein